MNRFKKVSLGELVQIKGGKRLPLGENFSSVPTSHPYIRARDIGSGLIKIQEAVFLPDAIAQKLWRYKVSKGDVCITIVGANVGEMGVVPPELDGANLTENAVRLTTNGRVAQEHLRYALLSEDALSQMKVLAGGAAQPKLGIYKIETIEIPLPPSLLTQRKIASVLSTYDDLIENNTRRIAILEAMAQAIYREWFVEFRFPGHENTKLVNSPLGKIPEGWKVEKVKAIVKRLKTNGHYTQNDVADSGSVPVIDQSTAELLGYHDNPPDLDARPGSPVIIFGDHTCKMELVITPFSIGPNVVPFQSATSLSVHYLYWLVNSLVETKEYKRHWSELTNKEVLVCNDDLSERFSKAITPLIEAMNLHRKRNRNLRKTRDLLLPMLISGQLDVEDLDIDTGEAVTE